MIINEKNNSLIFHFLETKCPILVFKKVHCHLLFLHIKNSNLQEINTHYIHSVLVQDCIRSSLLCESVSLLFAIARSCDAVSSSNRQELKPRQNIYTAKTLSKPNPE